MIMIGHKNENTPNNLVNIFSGICNSTINNGYASERKAPSLNQTHFQQNEVDTDIHQLSSRKLWQILKLSQIKGCELDTHFVEQVKDELLRRNDFDNGLAWREPH